ncbi:aminopeptidase [Jatrophihabitans sp. GAS493]|uniref:M1 family metallopeptidase n=1 Tax=Jatrophihabitans sp. GAS493 TaxID=1907575 RepID=UPI000BB89545|nr:M1 family metallopeptidase [Jatrophihabitans sp. GAS493]SOD71846.1 aminopeptidase [Jatrophihabitans sp. GAS493]
MSSARGVADPYVPDSGDLSFDVHRYDLELSYRLSSNRLAGRAIISARANSGISMFSLDLAGMQVKKVTVDGARVKRFVHGRRKLQVWLARTIPAGAGFVVEVHYSGNPKPLRGAWGSIGWEELDDGVIVASQPNGAASWFPCNDRPSNKASYRITFSTDSPYRVVSNGTLLSQRAGAGQTTWIFDQPEPMATYLASVQVGQYELLSIASAPVPQLAALPPRVRPRFDVDFGRQPLMMEIFTRLFGRYPYARYTVVITDDALEIPLEAQGMSVFGSNFVDGRRSYERLVAHELAHQWFGNSLTVAGWRDIWLNEGFACYAEWLFSEFSGGPTAQQLAAKYFERLRGLPQNLIIADPGPQLMFDDRLYKRGALTLHALRRRLGDAAFFELLLSWTAENAHGCVRTADFISHAQAWSSLSLDEFFDGWLFKGSLPNAIR